MPVSICFDDSHDARRLTYTLFDLVEVCGKIVEIDFSPGRPPGEKVLFSLGHVFRSYYTTRLDADCIFIESAQYDVICENIVNPVILF